MCVHVVGVLSSERDPWWLVPESGGFVGYNA